jgi:type I restriction enzyme S subunit
MMNELKAMPKYEAYKDSGVEWLGIVPEHWDLTRIATRFEERRTKVSDKNFAPLSVTKNGVVPQLSSAAKSNDGDNRKLVKNGDFVINSRSDRKGSSGVADRDGSVSLINIVMEPKNIVPKYCEYLLKSYNFIEEFYRMGHGIVADLWTTRYDEMKAVIVSIPPMSEQTAIANFLDKKTVQIDEAITIKEKQIELLKERKKIIIQQAVTQGLNPDVPMKDSGVDWIGRIPEHWAYEPIKHSLKGIIDCEHKTAPFVDEEDYFVVRTTNVKDGKLQMGGAKYTHEKGFKEWTQRGVPKPGDVLLTREAPAGEACLVPDNMNVCLGQRMVWLKVNKERLLPEFAISLIYSSIGRTYIDFLSSGSTVLHFNMADIKNIPVVLPPMIEQKELVGFIKKESRKVDDAIEIQVQQIEKLKEYKITLINSAVTGKIKVPELME